MQNIDIFCERKMRIGYGTCGMIGLFLETAVVEYLDTVMEIVLLGLEECLFDEELLGIDFAKFFFLSILTCF